jgi:GNAT superfamily N-acetyltransferase
VKPLELVSYEPSNFEDYVGLLGQAWGHQGLSAEEFSWWFLDNPAGSLMSVARIDGRVVGVAGHTLLRMVLGGEERLASFSVHATTLPEARGLGIFRELELKHEREAQERGVAVVLAFASAPTAPIFLGPLGWTEIGKLRIWARPAVGRRGDEPAQGFDFEGDAAAAWPNHVARDREHLQWRYAASPRGYTTLRSPNGYAVVWPRKGHRGRAIAVLADLAAPADEQHALLLRAARASRAHVLFGLPAPGQRGAFLRAGFLPTNRTLHFMGKPLAGRLDTDPAAWRFTLGDTDFF